MKILASEADCFTSYVLSTFSVGSGVLFLLSFSIFRDSLDTMERFTTPSIKPAQKAGLHFLKPSDFLMHFIFGKN